MDTNMKNNDVDYINATGAIYAWMCACDGKITESENKGFAEYLDKSPLVSKISYEDFMKSYLEVSKLFETDFDQGYQKTLKMIKSFKRDKTACINFVKVAREALVVDSDLDEVEENVMRELCLILDINEDKIN